MRLSPTLQVHTWGGYGSQLFGFLLTQYIVDLNPNRKCQLVFHSSGVTQRFPEIFNFLKDKNLNYKFINDYQPSLITESGLESFNIRVCLRKIVKFFLLKLKLVIDLDGNPDIRKIRYWTLQVRGTYNNISFPTEHLYNLYTYYECKNFAEIDKFDFDNILFVQYRIGDLFSLTNKTFISPQLLANLIQDKIKAFRQINLLVASDTPEKCIILIDYLGFDFTRKFFSPENTISAGLHARYFIGTNSKISLWIATLRALSSKESLIPVGFSKIQQVLLPLYFLKFVTYYDPLEIPNG